VDGIFNDFNGIFLGWVYMAYRLGIQEMDSTHYPGASNTPLNIAKKRYTKGEITKEQFEEIKKSL
jgi:putative membrane protein